MDIIPKLKQKRRKKERSFPNLMAAHIVAKEQNEPKKKKGFKNL